MDDPGEENGANEGDDGEDDKGERSNAADIAERVSGVFDGGMLFIAEVGLANPSRGIEEEWKPPLDMINEMLICMTGTEDYLSRPRTEPSKWLVSGLADARSF